MGITLNYEKKLNRWRVIFTNDRKQVKRDLGRNEKVAKDQYKKLLLRYYHVWIQRCLDELDGSMNKSEVMFKYDKQLEKMINKISRAYKIGYKTRRVNKQE